MEINKFLVFSNHDVIIGFTSLKFYRNTISIYLGSTMICSITDYKSIKVKSRISKTVYFTLEF